MWYGELCPDGTVLVLDQEPTRVERKEGGLWMEGQGIVPSLHPDPNPFTRTVYSKGLTGPWQELTEQET